MPTDILFLNWATGINASGLFREALTEQMSYRGINRSRLTSLVSEALRDEYELDDLVEQTSSMGDLEALLDNNQPHSAHQ